MAKKRSEVPTENQWNVEAFYPSFNDWQTAFQKAIKQDRETLWKELSNTQGKLGEKPEILKSALDQLFFLDRELSKLYTYAHLRHDEDIANDSHKVAYNQITSLLHEFAQTFSWIEPEILALPDDTIQNYLSSPILKDYKFHLEKSVRVKKHTLPPDQERLVALAGQALQTSHKAFSAINDADFKFGLAIDSKGQGHELTHGLYGIYIRDQDRELRQDAFKKLHGKYLKYENTLCELLNGQVQNHWFNARARRYPSCLEAALFPKNIDTGVYKALIQAVNQKIEILHKYIDLRTKILNVGPLHLYDMYVPLTPHVDIKMPYHEAENIVVESVAPLGATYQNLLKKGFKEQRWVDRYENQNKRSGAYSSGCYDSMPYILMNYKDLLRDVFTLAHEAGHSMHSLLTHHNQPYQYGQYPIFLAEVASTFNEELLMRLMLERLSSKEERIFLINQKIEDIRTTFFRQTMFAEFELFIHEMAEQNQPLTPRLLKEKYRELNAKYFGPTVVLDEESDIEWARIPHFYYNFYVFQYATGISAALALVDKVSTGGDKAREDYLNFLKSGCSRYPIDILRLAGVDMCTPAPVLATMHRFEELVLQLEKAMN